MGNANGKKTKTVSGDGFDDEILYVVRHGPGDYSETPVNIFQEEEALEDLEVAAEPVATASARVGKHVRFTLPDGSVVDSSQTEDDVISEFEFVEYDVASEYEAVCVPVVDSEVHREMPYHNGVHFGNQCDVDLWMTVDPYSKHPFVAKKLRYYKRHMHERVQLVWKYLQTSPLHQHFNDLTFIDDRHFAFNIHVNGQFPVCYRGFINWDNTVNVHIII